MAVFETLPETLGHRKCRCKYFFGRTTLLSSYLSLGFLGWQPMHLHHAAALHIRPTPPGNYVVVESLLRIDTDFTFCGSLTSLFPHEFELMYTEAAYFFHSGFLLCQTGGDQYCALDNSSGPKRPRHDPLCSLLPQEQP